MTKLQKERLHQQRKGESMVNTFKEKRKARRNKRKEEGKETIWWEILDITLDIAEIIGPILIRSVRSAIKFLDHH